MSVKKVVIYTQPDCSPCDTAKEFLKKKGVSFEEHNVREEPNAVMEMVQKYQSRSTPTIVVGEEVLIGFDPDRLEKLLSH